MEKIIVIDDEIKGKLHKAIGDCINNRISVEELNCVTMQVMDLQSQQINIEELMLPAFNKKYNKDVKTLTELFLYYEDYFQLEIMSESLFPTNESVFSVTYKFDPVVEMLIKTSLDVQKKKLNQKR